MGFYNGIDCEIDKNKFYIALHQRKVFDFGCAYCGS